MASGKSTYAPLAVLSVIAPSLEDIPDEEELAAVHEEDEDDESDRHSSLTAPLEVTFQDGADSIMSSMSAIDRSSSSSEEESSAGKAKIPDGGWGWMVVIAALLLSMIQDGISFSLGLLLVEFEYEFEETKSVTSWVGSLFVSVPLLSGPVMSALVDRYGCRAMTIVGGLVSTSGFLLSYFSKGIWFMYLTFGILSGLGLGLTFITAVVSIAFWFDKKRNLAVGLGACGIGIGTFIYAPFTTFLLYEYGWRWTVILLAGTLLNICVCGALMRDPEWIKEQNKQNSKLSKSNRSTKSSTVSLVSSPSAKVKLDEVKSLLKSGKDAEYILQTLATSVEPEDKEAKKEHYQSVVNLPTFIREEEKVPIEVLEQLSENKRLYNIILENYPSLLHCRSTSDKGLNRLVEDSTKINARVPVTLSFKLKKSSKPKVLPHQFSLPEEPFAEPLIANGDVKPKATKGAKIPRTNSAPWLVKQLNITSTHQKNYFKNVKFTRHSLIHRGAVLNKSKYRLRASSCPNIYRVSMTTIAKEEDDERFIYQKCKEVFDMSLFLEFHFFLLALSTIILFAWFMTPFFYLPDLMKDFGYSTAQASSIMSIIGITSTVGMVGFGWAGDQSWVSVSKTYAACMVLCGLFCSAIMIFITNYHLVAVCAGLYGIFLASSFSFTPTLLVELIPLERFTTAYGLILLCQGIGHLLGPPIAGLLYDITHLWDYSFHLSGIWIVISGLLILFIPYTNNRKMIGKGPVEKELSNE